MYEWNERPLLELKYYFRQLLGALLIALGWAAACFLASYVVYGSSELALRSGIWGAWWVGVLGGMAYLFAGLAAERRGMEASRRKRLRTRFVLVVLLLGLADQAGYQAMGISPDSEMRYRYGVDVPFPAAVGVTALVTVLILPLIFRRRR